MGAKVCVSRELAPEEQESDLKQKIPESKKKSTLKVSKSYK